METEIWKPIEGYEGFYHLNDINGNVEKATMVYIIRDHDKAKFEERKAFMVEQIAKMNEKYADRITNLREVVLSQNGATILIGEDENNPSIAFVLQDSPYRLVIDNDEIDIYENDKIISRWKTDTFTTTKLYFGTDVTNPSFGFVPRENGSLSFRKVG